MLFCVTAFDFVLNTLIEAPRLPASWFWHRKKRENA